MNLVGYCLCLIVLFAFIWENEGRRSCGKNRLASIERVMWSCGKVPLAEEDPVDGKVENSLFSYDLAKAGNFPSLVSIATRLGSNSAHNHTFGWCSGVLISDRHAITKASCLTGEVEIATTFANPGRWKSDTKRYKAKKICKSPKFRKTDNYGSAVWDFAVIYLEEAVELSDKVQPACLPDPEDLTNIRDGKQYWLAAEPMYFRKWPLQVNRDPNFNRLVPVNYSECEDEEDESHFCRQPIDKNRYTCYDLRYTGPLMSIDKDKPAVVYGLAIYGGVRAYGLIGRCESSHEKIVFSNLAEQSDHIKELISNCTISD